MLYQPKLRCFQARAFLFSSGFSMAFGAMFTKTYRVHQIFTRANRGLIKSKVGMPLQSFTKEADILFRLFVLLFIFYLFVPRFSVLARREISQM